MFEFKDWLISSGIAFTVWHKRDELLINVYPDGTFTDSISYAVTDDNAESIKKEILEIMSNKGDDRLAESL